MPKFLNELRELTLLKIGAFLAGAAAIGVVVGYCLIRKDELLWLLALAGGVVGWVVGVLAAPYSDDEKQRFGEFAKVISGFVTGYVLSKLDPVIEALVAVPKGSSSAAILQHPAAEQILVTLTSFGIALIFVFSGRLYWSSTEKALQEWIEQQPNPKPSRSEAIERLVKTTGNEG